MSAGKDIFGDRAAAGPAAAVLSLALGACARARARSRSRRGPARRFPRGRRGVRDQAERQPRSRAARVRRRGSRERCALHRLGDARGAGARQPGALPARFAARDPRERRLRERRDRPARARRRRQDPGRRGDRRRGRRVHRRARLDRRHQPVPAGGRDAERASSPPTASCAARATPTSSRRSRRPTRSRSAPAWRSSSPAVRSV